MKRLASVLALLAVLLFNLPKILYFGRNMWMSIDTGHKMVDTTLTMDQKLSDLDYMYEIGLVDGETN